MTTPNQNLKTAMDDLRGAIEGIALGSVEAAVIESAQRELISSWNDHNSDDVIDEGAEMKLFNCATLADGAGGEMRLSPEVNCRRLRRNPQSAERLKTRVQSLQVFRAIHQPGCLSLSELNPPWAACYNG